MKYLFLFLLLHFIVLIDAQIPDFQCQMVKPKFPVDWQTINKATDASTTGSRIFHYSAKFPSDWRINPNPCCGLLVDAYSQEYPAQALGDRPYDFKVLCQVNVEVFGGIANPDSDPFYKYVEKIASTSGSEVGSEGKIIESTKEMQNGVAVYKMLVNE